MGRVAIDCFLTYNFIEFHSYHLTSCVHFFGKFGVIQKQQQQQQQQQALSFFALPLFFSSPQ